MLTLLIRIFGILRLIFAKVIIFSIQKSFFEKKIKKIFFSYKALIISNLKDISAIK